MTPPLWTGSEAAVAMHAAVTGRLPAAITGISIDTRTLEPGDLFFAIQGDARDGHDFVETAFQRGAAGAVVSGSRAEHFVGAGTLFAVDDVLDAMRALGLAARASTAAAIVAVTGSVGKTGTKEALRLVLERQGRTHASLASYNNHWGVPLTLARMPRESAFGVFEVGMNHAGEIAPLTRMVRPHVAIITTVEPVHIEHFRSVSGIADAKGEIFAGLEPGGTAVINRDNPHFERLKAHAGASRAGRIVTFGEHEAADIRAERIVPKPDVTVVEARAFGEAFTYRLGMPGRHIALNSLSVLAAVHALGADLALAALSLADLKPPAGRGERTVLDRGDGPIVLVDETYNANPASMRAMLETVGGLELGFRGRRIAVLGDMLELGPEGPALHAGLVEPLLAHGVDLVFAAGPLMRELWNALPPERRGAYAETSADLADEVSAAVRPGDVVAVKGSRGIKMERVVERLKGRFSAPADASAGE
ncbi:UDP-N-acetylmuramoylalanyl-D-glutamyl-2,6-diaminopimelate--D-alanyl-D-alanine ligase [Salinarimonas soli]|uniref:UDP-N-acetylmuramoyl-tripeptide--D-alanyl-D-alanine ligase n=1 Tax=Salinarimonas soli TaxID=1638099 RepID=A0A5B2VJ24_9HYPH|nr:UDP-N-acetylmuramoylalanyl-D-glutamyl-2,6-diaminopimelate--D-alanyl-D-alanine ligase [Salinarimonas soli]KAA2238342.1 UDP-N-acetylmuramoylalanyl-D-glutamyl-2,6-diaminopimelate--D-alanyl-D-alanine ligase [Salinarimonas soli]